MLFDMTAPWNHNFMQLPISANYLFQNLTASSKMIILVAERIKDHPLPLYLQPHRLIKIQIHYTELFTSIHRDL